MVRKVLLDNKDKQIESLEEDLLIDVTSIVSASAKSLINDYGFLIGFSRVFIGFLWGFLGNYWKLLGIIVKNVKII